MVKLKVNVKTKNDSIPSDTTKRKMPVITNPKILKHPRRHESNVGNVRFKVKFEKDTVKPSPTIENPDIIIEPRHNETPVGDIKFREKNGSEVVLTDCRRLWCWYGAASISQLAVEGTKRPSECKFTLVVPTITMLGVIEIIPCTEEAVKSIEEVDVWKNR